MAPASVVGAFTWSVVLPSRVAAPLKVIEPV